MGHSIYAGTHNQNKLIGQFYANQSKRTKIEPPPITYYIDIQDTHGDVDTCNEILAGILIKEKTNESNSSQTSPAIYTFIWDFNSGKSGENIGGSTEYKTRKINTLNNFRIVHTFAEQEQAIKEGKDAVRIITLGHGGTSMTNVTEYQQTKMRESEAAKETLNKLGLPTGDAYNLSISDKVNAAINNINSSVSTSCDGSSSSSSNAAKIDFAKITEALNNYEKTKSLPVKDSDYIQKLKLDYQNMIQHLENNSLNFYDFLQMLRITRSDYLEYIACLKHTAPYDQTFSFENYDIKKLFTQNFDGITELPTPTSISRKTSTCSDSGRDKSEPSQCHANSVYTPTSSSAAQIQRIRSISSVNASPAQSPMFSPTQEHVDTNLPHFSLLRSDSEAIIRANSGTKSPVIKRKVVVVKSRAASAITSPANTASTPKIISSLIPKPASMSALYDLRLITTSSVNEDMTPYTEASTVYPTTPIAPYFRSQLVPMDPIVPLTPGGLNVVTEEQSSSLTNSSGNKMAELRINTNCTETDDAPQILPVRHFKS